MDRISIKEYAPSNHHHPIIGFQSPHTRALNVGYIQKNGTRETFVPCRLHLGTARAEDSYEATVESFSLPQVKAILSRYKPEQISTVTVLRETLACRLGDALSAVGIKGHFGDAYIGATHIKGDGAIRTAYLYENTEGLVPDGLWIVSDSLCIGRNLSKTMESLLSKFTPKELLFVGTIASRRAINAVDDIVSQKGIPATYIAWGSLFGVDETTLYDMPWGHPDTEALDPRDKEVFLKMYGPNLCVGGDFGNNFFSPTLAKKLYEDQLAEHQITPHFPTVAELSKIYHPGELLIKQ